MTTVSFGDTYQSYENGPLESVGTMRSLHSFPSDGFVGSLSTPTLGIKSTCTPTQIGNSEEVVGTIQKSLALMRAELTELSVMCQRLRNQVGGASHFQHQNQIGFSDSNGSSSLDRVQKATPLDGDRHSDQRVTLTDARQKAAALTSLNEVRVLAIRKSSVQADLRRFERDTFNWTAAAVSNHHVDPFVSHSNKRRGEGRSLTYSSSSSQSLPLSVSRPVVAGTCYSHPHIPPYFAVYITKEVASMHALCSLLRRELEVIEQHLVSACSGTFVKTAFRSHLQKSDEHNYGAYNRSSSEGGGESSATIAIATQASGDGSGAKVAPRFHSSFYKSSAASAEDPYFDAIGTIRRSGDSFIAGVRNVGYAVDSRATGPATGTLHFQKEGHFVASEERPSTRPPTSTQPSFSSFPFTPLSTSHSNSAATRSDPFTSSMAFISDTNAFLRAYGLSEESAVEVAQLATQQQGQRLPAFGGDEEENTRANRHVDAASHISTEAAVSTSTVLPSTGRGGGAVSLSPSSFSTSASSSTFNPRTYKATDFPESFYAITAAVAAAERAREKIRARERNEGNQLPPPLERDGRSIDVASSVAGGHTGDEGRSRLSLPRNGSETDPMINSGKANTREYDQDNPLGDEGIKGSGRRPVVDKGGGVVSRTTMGTFAGEGEGEGDSLNTHFNEGHQGKGKGRRAETDTTTTASLAPAKEQMDEKHSRTNANAANGDLLLGEDTYSSESTTDSRAAEVRGSREEGNNVVTMTTIATPRVADEREVVALTLQSGEGREGREGESERQGEEAGGGDGLYLVHFVSGGDEEKGMESLSVTRSASKSDEEKEEEPSVAEESANAVAIRSGMGSENNGNTSEVTSRDESRVEGGAVPLSALRAAVSGKEGAATVIRKVKHVSLVLPEDHEDKRGPVDDNTRKNMSSGSSTIGGETAMTSPTEPFAEATSAKNNNTEPLSLSKTNESNAAKTAPTTAKAVADAAYGLEDYGGLFEERLQAYCNALVTEGTWSSHAHTKGKGGAPGTTKEKRYFAHKTTRKTVWDLPKEVRGEFIDLCVASLLERALWVHVVPKGDGGGSSSDKKRPYYFNKATRETCWDLKKWVEAH